MIKIPAKNILIRTPNWLGDALMATPAIQAIRELYPTAKLTVVSPDALVDLWTPGILIDYWLAAPKSRKLSSLYKFSRELQKYQFDLSIILTYSISSKLEFAFSGIPNRLGYKNQLGNIFFNQSMQIPEQPLHQIDYYLNLIAYLGETSKSRKIYFHIGQNYIDSTNKLLDELKLNRNDILIGLSSGAAYGKAKCWLPERYIELGKRFIKELNAKIVLFGGENERDSIQSIADKLGNSAYNLAGKTKLAELAYALTQCRLLITNDSGPMHLAAALSVPILAIFGPTDIHYTRPHSLGIVKIIYNPPECAPCFLRECPLDHRCMTAITVDEVYASALSLLKSNAEF